jgi:hypothetical protein
MTFLQLQNAVMSDRFDEPQRGDVKTWLNSAYWQLWTLEEWTFRYRTTNVTVTVGSKNVTGAPSNLGVIRSFSRRDGELITPLTQTEYERLYYDQTQTWTGYPCHYTVINGSVLVGPASSETASDYLIVDERAYTSLANDGDTAAIPEGSELALVFKASATGLKLQNDYTWQFHEQDYQEQLDALRRGYLVDRRDQNASYAADPLGGY